MIKKDPIQPMIVEEGHKNSEQKIGTNTIEHMFIYKLISV